MAAGEQKIRLFAAVYPSEEAQEALGKTMAEFEAAAPNLARWVRPERVHLTLRFFGDMPRPEAATILEAMARVPAEFNRGGFKLGLARLGTFGQPSNPRVIWAGADGNVEALGDLHGALDRELVKAGFGPDKQPYRPHMTLGRPRNARNRQAGTGAGDGGLGLAGAAQGGVEGGGDAPDTQRAAARDPGVYLAGVGPVGDVQWIELPSPLSQRPRMTWG